MTLPDPGTLLSQLATIVGVTAVETDASALAGWSTDWRGRFTGRALALVSPGSSDEVQAVVRLAAAAGVPIVAQGGNTSMVAGAIPDASGTAILLSLRRMNRIRSLVADDRALVAEAGVVLAAVHDAAEGAGLRFPLSLGAKGTATIGGLISTNAGGTQVLRFGTMRPQLLGIEAVLADGSRIDALAPLRKDNRGYDLTGLLAGAEGTLGIVTAATLRLVAPVRRAVAWIGLADPADALAVLGRLQARTGEAVESFELVPAVALDLVLRHLPGARAPLGPPAPWNALAEIGLAPALPDPVPLLASELAACAKEGRLLDAVVAQSEREADALWALREGVPEAERKDGLAAKHDIAVPVSRMPAFIVAATGAVETRFPGTRVIAFGHLGDGNVHFNVRAPAGVDDRRAWLEAEGGAISAFVHDLVGAEGGTISAEHGIGQVKLSELARTLPAGRLAALVAIKRALDPAGLLNPGRLVSLAPREPRQ